VEQPSREKHILIKTTIVVVGEIGCGLNLKIYEYVCLFFVITISQITHIEDIFHH
jgi:FMN phosphatase YigB (HAD superfamily)